MAYKYRGTKPTIEPVKSLYRCGTREAYRQHLRDGETPCAECEAAYGRPKVEPTPRVLRPCGTQAAYTRHITYGETPCEPCVIAHRKSSRESKQRRKKK